MEHTKDITTKGRLFAALLRLVRKTWRVRIEGREYLDQYYQNDKRCLIGFWHGKYVPIFPLLEGYEACVITSLSTRGSIIGEICRSFGYQNAQIPDEPQLDTFKQMLKDLEGVQVCGTALDGPLGPYHQTKSGLIRLCGMLDLALVPVTVYNARHLTATKRWDCLEFPLPFSRICLIFGKPITIAPHLTKTQRNTLSKQIDDELDVLQLKAEAILRR
ncbi:MAG: lysophospholipid acyltransferase family protein [Sphaerochaeta sp.]|uniref:lysophospholipid acyltransferase family protein n=1 Tax=Sphaerochaeta sp. TaxID=1972642 RepID=UPI002FCC13B2